MIIRRNEITPLLIRQPDHAELAVSIMSRWRADGLLESPRRTAILLAIKEHDNGWHEVDAAPIVDPGSGEILDFMNLPDDERRGVWPRGVQRLASTPYAAALVAQHAVHIYRRYRDDEGWTRFFREMEGWRDHYLSQAPGASMDELLRDYLFVRVGDLASLTYCNGWREAPDETTHSITCHGERLTISPDPFGGASLSIAVAARKLPSTRFESAATAAAAFHVAPRVKLTGTVAGPQ